MGWWKRASNPSLSLDKEPTGFYCIFYEEVAATEKGHARWCIQSVSRRALPGNSCWDLCTVHAAVQPCPCYAPWAVWVWVVISELLSSSKNWHRHSKSPQFLWWPCPRCQPFGDPLLTPQCSGILSTGARAGWAASHAWGKLCYRLGLLHKPGKPHWFWS